MDSKRGSCKENEGKRLINQIKDGHPILKQYFQKIELPKHINDRLKWTPSITTYIKPRGINQEHAEDFNCKQEEK